ncbi:LysR family transcriptional regulator [Nitrospirillum sp. BR 11164]|uniref:LysR family transcriptional regulator n=1 Tax=Nitrospirillum sp. BR 11164 TaxID=3104324 RepID=UPI002AFED67A|nr:LysR family transcriptional regulator [Nitrospirillum sp. BR 11164]MEA1647942.1 LysR family transcriptional regulator [Nitrospirillum sp. BR 11164]
MKIDPRRLMEFLAVARHGSFNSAAAASRVSQPALSKNIALLERETGVRLLDRDRTGARLNSFGESLVHYAQALETLLERAGEELSLKRQGIEGPLAIGVTPVAAAALVPRALEVMTRQTPRVMVSVVEGLDDELSLHLRQGQLDLIVGPLGVGPHYEDLIEEPLFMDRAELIMRPDHPLAPAATLNLRDLQSASWVLPSAGSVFRRQLETLFVTAGTRWPTGGITTNSILAIKSIVMTTDSVALMSPQLTAVERAAGRLRSIPLADAQAVRPVGLILNAKAPRSPLAARFIAIMRDIILQDPHSG